jgi:hypothetical protein
MGGTYRWYASTFLEPREAVTRDASSTTSWRKSSSAFAAVVMKLAMYWRDKSGSETLDMDIQITTGVACATLPTSSSFCIIFLMRACVNRIQHKYSHRSKVNGHVANLIYEFSSARANNQYTHNGELCSLVPIFHGGCPNCVI